MIPDFYVIVFYYSLTGTPITNRYNIMAILRLIASVYKCYYWVIYSIITLNLHEFFIYVVMTCRTFNNFMEKKSF